MCLLKTGASWGCLKERRFDRPRRFSGSVSPDRVLCEELSEDRRREVEAELAD